MLYCPKWNILEFENMAQGRSLQKNITTLLKALSIEDNDFSHFTHTVSSLKNSIFLIQKKLYIFLILLAFRDLKIVQSTLLNCIFYYFETDVFLMKYSCFLKCYCHN